MANKNQVWDVDLLKALEHIREERNSFSPAALFAFSDLTRPELQKFAETWVELDAPQRQRVVTALVDLAEERFEADFNRIFRYLIEDEDATVREQAINGLWEDEDASLIKPLIGALRSDAAARVRAAAAVGLGGFLLRCETEHLTPERGEEIYEALLAVVRNAGEDRLVRRRAIESIAYRGNETVRDIIASTYADEDAEMRATAIFAMGRSADRYWRRTIGQELYSPDPQLRFEAARAAGELEYKPAVPRLIELLDDPDREVQSACIVSLGQLGGKQAREALDRLIEGDDEIARELAQDALDELEFTEGAELLLYDMGLAGNEADALVEEAAVDWDEEASAEEEEAEDGEEEED